MKREDMADHRPGLLRWALLGAAAAALGATAYFGFLTGAKIAQGWGYLMEPEMDSLSHVDGLLLAGGLLLVLLLALAVRFLPEGRERGETTCALREEIAGRGQAKRVRGRFHREVEQEAGVR